MKSFHCSDQQHRHIKHEGKPHLSQRGKITNGDLNEAVKQMSVVCMQQTTWLPEAEEEWEKYPVF